MKHQDEEWLREQFVEKGKSASAVANAAGVSRKTMRKWLNRYGLNHTAESTRYRDEPWLREQIKDRGRTTTDIGDECGVSRQTIGYWARRYDIGLGPDEKYRDEEWLREQVENRSLPAGDVARKCGASKKTIYRWLNKFDIEPPGIEHGRKYHNEEWLREQYHGKDRGPKDIADECGVSQRTIRSWLKRLGIERKTFSVGVSDKPSHVEMTDEEWESLKPHVRSYARMDNQLWYYWLKKGMRCTECGESVHPSALDFHHREADEKSRGVSSMVNEGASIEELWEEIEKCDPVCANCHRRLHTVTDRRLKLVGDYNDRIEAVE